MPKTFVSPVILKIFRIRSWCRPDPASRHAAAPLQAVSQRPEAGGAGEPGLVQVDDELAAALAGQVDERLTQPRRGAGTGLVLGGDGLGAVPAVVT